MTTDGIQPSCVATVPKNLPNYHAQSPDADPIQPYPCSLALPVVWGELHLA